MAKGYVLVRLSLAVLMVRFLDRQIQLPTSKMERLTISLGMNHGNRGERRNLGLSCTISED